MNLWTKISLSIPDTPWNGGDLYRTYRLEGSSALCTCQFIIIIIIIIIIFIIIVIIIIIIIFIIIIIIIIFIIIISCTFSYTPLTSKDDKERHVTTLWPDAYYIVNHKYCYMTKCTDRS